MDNALRDDLTRRAFLFDDPGAYLAGVDAALRGLSESDPDGRNATAQRSPVRQR